MAVPTPDISHLSAKDYHLVYEPAEDSFLLMDALEKDLEVLKKNEPCLCVEIGSGSGSVINFLASIFKHTSYYLAVDVNIHACKCSQRTFVQNNIYSFDCVCDNLLHSTNSRLHGSIDILLFNPPYVPTPSEENKMSKESVMKLALRYSKERMLFHNLVGGIGIEASWSGGRDGREVIDRMLPLVTSLLSDDGLFYLLVLDENNPDSICQLMKSQGLDSKVILTRRTGPEKLSVIRFSRYKKN